FSNLIANAVKYSPNGGAIAVEAAVAADKATVYVTDRGIGIPAADIGRLFERYYRGGDVFGIVRTGVRPHLVKAAVDLHKGRIEVVSEEGSGSRFTVSLPLVPRLRKDSRKTPQPRTARDVPSIVTSSDNVTS